MTDDKRCKLCQEPVPQITIYTLNRIAVKRGFCSWTCLTMKLGYDEVSKIIEKEKVEGMNIETGLNHRGKPHQGIDKAMQTRDKANGCKGNV